MTRDGEPLSDPADPLKGAAEALGAHGLPPEAAAAVAAFEAAWFHWLRLAAKGELAALILPRLDADLDLALFQGMTALLRLREGIGRAPAEPTIGLLAAEMAVDPSRASRIAASLVERGLARREAAQADGRKSVLDLTPEGRRVLGLYRQEKWRLLARIFADWSPAEVEGFAGGVGRYLKGVKAAMEAEEGPGGTEPEG